MFYLQKEEIIFINKKTIESHGGQFLVPFNLLQEGHLDYLVDIVKSEIFGVEVYPTLADKASIYMFNIISNHVFSDGNKRTGLEAAILFLDLNNARIDKKYSKLELYNFTMQLASGQLSIQEVQAWFEENIVEEYL
jgi:death on curing protein